MECGPLCHRPGLTCPRWWFQGFNRLVETQLLVTDPQPVLERPRDPSHVHLTCFICLHRHCFQEMGGGVLYFNQPPESPFNQSLIHRKPGKYTTVVRKKETNKEMMLIHHLLFSSSSVSKHILSRFYAISDTLSHTVVKDFFQR